MSIFVWKWKWDLITLITDGGKQTCVTVMHNGLCHILSNQMARQFNHESMCNRETQDKKKNLGHIAAKHVLLNHV
jgi:hypothetical protein